ncbi:MAG: hypothetical protein M0C28_42270 [Candidatus Moduliflexus flocculans]|nr:hypothetical protein [Candidatus Moduliflexus flocculans]
MALLLTLTTLSFAPQEARVLRFPAVSADQIVFTYAGDLYTVAARRRCGPQADLLPRGLRGLRPLFARRRSRSPSPASTTATARSTSSRPGAACPSA